MIVNEKTIQALEPLLETFTQTTVLIAGATGMIGQNLIAILLAMNDELNANIHLIAHVRNEVKADRLFRKYSDRPDFEVIISDVNELKVEGNVDYIIHTAGVTGGSKQHIDYPMRTISTALDGTKNVLDIAVEKNCKGVVYLSSLEVYGNSGLSSKDIYETDGGYIDPTNVRSSYSESKRMCECICASYTKQFGISTYIARLTATFGYGVAYTDNRVFAQFARSIIEKKDIILKSTGETVRNYCDAEDAATAILILLAKGEPGTAYNVANMDTEISIKDLAEKFIERFPENNISLKFDLKEDVAELGYNTVMRNVLNSNKLMSLGWKPVFDMQDMIKRLVDSMMTFSKE